MTICYKRNFLKNVIAKVDFATPMVNLNSASLTDTIGQIKSRFPIAEQTTAFQHQVQISSEKIQNSKLEFPEWRFHGPEREKTFKFNQMFIEVLLKRYTSENNFKDDLVHPISSILRIDPQMLVRRTSIRFVNIFDFPIDNKDSIAEYFSGGISSHIKFLDNPGACIRSFIINEYVRDDLKIKVQSGLFNPDYPAVIKRNHFVLDIEASYDLPHTINDIEAYFEKLHSAIQEFFESFISQRLRDEILNG